MPTITIENDKEVIADFAGYSGKIARGAVSALNRAIKSGRTAMAKEIAGDTGMKYGDVLDALAIQQATQARLEATFAAKLKRIPLKAFNAKQTKSGVSYNLGKGRSLVASAFIARMKSSHEGVFKRKYVGSIGTRMSKRLPIVELFGPSLGHVFGKHRPLGLARTKEAFDTAFAHELKRLTDKQGGSPDA